MTTGRTEPVSPAPWATVRSRTFAFVFVCVCVCVCVRARAGRGVPPRGGGQEEVRSPYRLLSNSQDGLEGTESGRLGTVCFLIKGSVSGFLRRIST